MASRHKGLKIRCRGGAFRRAAVAALVALLGAAGPGQAREGEEGEWCRLEYVMKLSGLEVGKLTLELERRAGEARARMRLKNKGIARLFMRLSARMEGRVVLEDGIVRPAEFRIRYEKPGRVRDIRLRYDQSGRIVDLRYVNNGRLRDSDVPERLRQATVDPMTAFLRLQGWLTGGPEIGERIRIPVFEGRKRLDVEVEYRGLARPQDDRIEGPVHRLRARLIGIYGFEGGYGFVSDPDEEPNWLDVLASEEPCPAPLRVVGESRLYKPKILRRKARSDGL